MNAGNSTLSVFDLVGSGAAVTVISGGRLYGPSGAAVDANGELYLTSPVLDSVSMIVSSVLRLRNAQTVAHARAAAAFASTAEKAMPIATLLLLLPAAI